MALDDDLLQRYYDGDLSLEEERRVQAELATDGRARARLAELTRLGALMREPVWEAAQKLDGDALFARIEADIQKQKALGFGERLRVISSEWMAHRRGLLVPALASAAAAAAALVILLVPRHARQPALQEPSAAVSVHGSSIENVNFGENTGTVFQVDNQGVSAAVVWIADDEEEAP